MRPDNKLQAKAYDEGSLAWDEYYKSGWTKKPKNPYPLNQSVLFKCWNRGWNENLNGVKK